MINALDYVSGAVANGTDCRPGLDQALLALVAQGGVMGGTIYFPAGVYRLFTPWDWRLAFTAQDYYHYEIRCEQGCIFQSAVSGLAPAIYLAAAEGGALNFFDIKLGGLDGSLAIGDGIIFRNLSDSFLKIGKATSYNGTAVCFDTTGTPSRGIYNNLIEIGALLNNAIGLLGRGQISPHGFQGNCVRIGHVRANMIGIELRGQSTSNQITVASLEANPTRGILDSAGYNEYEINFRSDTIQTR